MPKNEINVIKILESRIEIHRRWAEYFETHREKEDDPEFNKLGNALFHRKHIKEYEFIIAAWNTRKGQATLEDLQEQNRELRGDRVAGMATERVLAAAHEKIEELQSKLATAVDALDIAYGMVNTEKGYCPQCSDGSGAYYDNHGEVCQCQWCFEANRIKKALAAIRNEGESIKIRPMPDKCTICFAHPRMIASCDHCNGTGKEPK